MKESQGWKRAESWLARCWAGMGGGRGWDAFCPACDTEGLMWLGAVDRRVGRLGTVAGGGGAIRCVPRRKEERHRCVVFGIPLVRWTGAIGDMRRKIERKIYNKNGRTVAPNFPCARDPIMGRQLGLWEWGENSTKPAKEMGSDRRENWRNRRSKPKWRSIGGNGGSED